MKTALILGFILLLLSFHSEAQQTIDKLNTNQLKLPKESASKALILDATGQVKSSSTVTDTELSYLDGLTDTILNLLSGKEPTITSGTSSQYWRGDKTFQTLDKNAVGLSNVDNTSDANKPISTATQTALNAKADDSVVVKLTGNQSINGVKTFTGKIVASTTTNGAIPCPVMTQTQRDAFSASQGDCVYNTTALQLNIYDGTVWKSAGGSGGISLWLTGTSYAVNDVVIQSDKIYRCLTAHTSGTFATDLSAGKWTEVSASPSTPYSLANGGTNKALTAVNGGIVWVDADSFEVLAAGVSGQVLQSNGAASPSWVNKSITAKAGSNASVTAEELQVRNNLLTSTATNKHLIEVGNKNILSNPGFEHSSFLTGWTNSGVATPSENTTTIYDGSKSAYFNPLVETVSLRQVSTLNSSNLGGTQGLASVRVKSSYALKVCAVIDNVVSTTLCVDVQANNQWGLYKVPFIMGSTSSGISIASTGNVPSANIYIDDAFVGPVDLKQDINSVGAWTSFTPTGTFTTNTTYKGKYRQVGDTIEVYTELNFAGAPNATNLIVNIPSQFTIDTSKMTSAGLTELGLGDGTASDAGVNSYALVPKYASTTTIQPRFMNNVPPIGNAPVVTQAVPFTIGAGDAIYLHYSVPVTQLSNATSVYSSTNADTDWIDGGTITIEGTTTNPTKPTVTTRDKVFYKRHGDRLLLRYEYSHAAATGAAAGSGDYLFRIPSAANCTIDSAKIGFSNTVGVNSAANNSTVVGASSAGITGASAAVGFSSVYSSNQLRMMVRPSSTTTTQATGSAFYELTQANLFFGFEASVPCVGWQNSNIIIGQFNGLESCTDSYQCTDTYSAKVDSTGLVTSENIDWISGNCSNSSGLGSCTFKTGLFTVTPSCSVTYDGSGTTFAGRTASIRSSSSTQILYITEAGSVTAASVNIICQKQGADYIGKTAKAVASDQNTSSVGVTKGTLLSFGFSGATEISNCTTSPCTIYNPVGVPAGFSVVRASTGTYDITFPANFWSNLDYNCAVSTVTFASGEQGGFFRTNARTNTTLRVVFRNSASTVVDAAAAVVCFGTRN